MRSSGSDMDKLNIRIKSQGLATRSRQSVPAVSAQAFAWIDAHDMEPVD